MKEQSAPVFNSAITQLPNSAILEKQLDSTSLKIAIPTPLRPFAGGQSDVEVEGSTVGAALRVLTERYPDLRRHLYSDDGKLRAFVNIYVNDEDIRYLEKENTPLGAGDSISIVPSIAGGRRQLKMQN
jgi:adenylyltransferase/sulfurtransferase